MDKFDTNILLNTKMTHSPVVMGKYSPIWKSFKKYPLDFLAFGKKNFHIFLMQYHLQLVLVFHFGWKLIYDDFCSHETL